MPLEAGRWLGPDWPDLPRVRAVMSTRLGAGQGADFDLSGAPQTAQAHRQALAAAVGGRPVWLHQVHGAEVVVLPTPDGPGPVTADASVTAKPGLACVVRIADCLPVLLAAGNGHAVGAAHAGWRGLAAGILENSVRTLCTLSDCHAAEVRAWMGPCIGPRAFEVGEDVLRAFGCDPACTDDSRFRRADRRDGSRRWLADLAGLARQRLQAAGVLRIDGGTWCTVEDASMFFSFRRDRATGRMAAAIAISG